MSALSIQPTYPIFTDIDGQPLEDGYVWLGAANADPQGSPISVYWDVALTELATQPIRTKAGYPTNAGVPGRLYVNSDYSIQVMNRNGSTVYSAPEATERYSAVVFPIDASEVTYDPPFTGSVATNVEAKLAQTVSVKDFGAVGDGVTDDTAAIQAAILAADSIYFPAGVYLVSSTIYTRGAFDGIWFRGKNLFGAGIEATTIKAAVGFTDSFVIFIGNQDYVSITNPVYCIQNQLSDMTIEHENIPDTAFNSGVALGGTWNNKISNLKIGVVAYPFTRWDLNITNGTYTTIVDSIHCQNIQATSSLVGDITTICFYGCSATFLNLYGATSIGFDHLVMQGTYSGVYQYNRVQIDNCANVDFHAGDLEGDGRMFTISASQSIHIVNNNVAMPGSFTKDAVDEQSIFITASACVGILSRDNVFMNWLQGPLGEGIYLEEPVSPNRNMQTCDFNGMYFTGASYYRNSTQTIVTATNTVVNFNETKYDSGTYKLSSFVGGVFTYTPLVTIGAYWVFTSPLRAFYSVKASVTLTGLNTATESAYIAVYVGGVEVWRKWNTSSNVSGLTTLDIASDVYADSTSVINIIVWHNGAGSVIIPTAATTNFVQISLINER